MWVCQIWYAVYKIPIRLMKKRLKWHEQEESEEKYPLRGILNWRRGFFILFRTKNPFHLLFFLSWIDQKQIEIASTSFLRWEEMVSNPKIRREEQVEKPQGEFDVLCSGRLKGGPTWDGGLVLVSNMRQGQGNRPMSPINFFFYFRKKYQIILRIIIISHSDYKIKNKLWINILCGTKLGHISITLLNINVK